MRKGKTEPDKVHAGGCTIVLAAGQVEHVKNKIKAVLADCIGQITLDVDHERIHIGDGEVRITPEGGLIGYVDKDKKRSFGLWRDDFTSVVKVGGETFWSRQ